MRISRDTEVKAATQSLRAQLGRRIAVLALGSGSGIQLAGTRAELAVRQASERWRLIGYHTISHGGWDQAANEFWWVERDGQSYRFGLDAPGRLPELFRERMTATVVCDQLVAEGPNQVRVIARRDLADPAAPLLWESQRLKGQANDPALERLRERALQAAKLDYTIA